MSKISASNAGHDLAQTLQRLFAENPGLEFVDLQWVDFSGVLRGRMLPISHCLQLALSEQPHNAGCFSMVGLALGYALQFPEHILPGSRDALYPDWSSCKLVETNRASVMCCVSEEPLLHTPATEADLFKRCPRSVLKNVLEVADLEHSLTFLAGMELEFYLLQEGQKEPPPDATYSCWSIASAMRGPSRKCLEDCVKTLELAGIAVEQAHAEYASHQYEISTGPRTVLQTVDAMVQSQDIIKNVCIKHGFRACFLPKPFPRFAPSGLHVHISLEYDASAAKRSRLMDCFLAGVLERLPLLCAFAMPTEESYARVNHEDLGEWVSWGTENRMTPIRKISEDRFEFRAFDFTSNPYLSIAAYIAAGLLGVQENSELHVQDFAGFLVKTSEEERDALGVKQRLPTSISETLALMKEDWKGLDKILGLPVLEYYAMIKDGERFSFSKVSKEARSLFFLENF
ncbi:hypothetical protein F5882DRAFT_526038 [Hyaloscypha sp. PMI_1271]|nr:hypothetical protein F5882DRAFT_526038 [Hyaloscypha sp. PMI_1271]